MKKLLIVGLCMVGFVSNAQKQIEAKELSRKEIRALVKAEKRKKQIEEFAKQGLNEYGIDENAQTWFLALRYYIPGGKQDSGIPILRSAASFSTGKKFPLWVIDGTQFDFPPMSPMQLAPLITEVRILNSMSEINKYGQLGRAGVIVLKTKLVDEQ
ncbi:MAG: hypothetical protein ACPG7X_09055 [Flavobacteriaceae bacterium]